MTPRNEVIEKPVIYLYPEVETDIEIKLTVKGNLSTTYPSYNGGWKVTAYPDGRLVDTRGISYNYLYWEAEDDTVYPMDNGFCVKGTDTAAFLEKTLEKLGLTRREANEFIVYWLPRMESNPYNVITFQTIAYQEGNKLTITPEPDTLIRVFMTWYSSDEEMSIPSQEIDEPCRNGFTVVEWGGMEIK